MLVVVLVWGLNFVIAKSALAQIPPLAFAALRFTCGAVLLFGVLHVTGGLALPTRQHWRTLIVLGIVGNTIYQSLFMLGLRHTTAGNSALLIAIVPALVALVGALLGIERLTRRVALGIALAFVGVALVVSARGLTLSAETLRGDGLLLACAVAWSAYTLGVRAIGGALSPLQITAWTTLAGVPGLLLLGLPDLLGTNWRAVDGWAWGGLAYATVLALGLAYLLWNTSVRAVGTNRTAIYQCVTPLVATLAAWPLLGEVPTPLQAGGAALIIGGVLTARLQLRAPLTS